MEYVLILYFVLLFRVRRSFPTWWVSEPTTPKSLRICSGDIPKRNALGVNQGMNEDTPKLILILKRGSLRTKQHKFLAQMNPTTSASWGMHQKSFFRQRYYFVAEFQSERGNMVIVQLKIRFHISTNLRRGYFSLNFDSKNLKFRTYAVAQLRELCTVYHVSRS